MNSFTRQRLLYVFPCINRIRSGIAASGNCVFFELVSGCCCVGVLDSLVAMASFMVGSSIGIRYTQASRADKKSTILGGTGNRR